VYSTEIFNSIDVVEMTHGQHSKGFLLSQSRKKRTIGEVFFGKSQYNINKYMCLQSYTKVHVPRGWAHNLGGLIIRRLLIV